MRASMSTTKFPTSSLARVLAFTMAATATTACHPGSRPLSPDTASKVTQVGSARYEGTAGSDEEKACRDWRLTAQEVENFFRLSERYDENPYSQFYQIPCSISGKLNAGEKSWDFVIGGGATATWTDGKETRYWGCAAKACAPLVLMPYDGMNPDQ